MSATILPKITPPAVDPKLAAEPAVEIDDPAGLLGMLAGMAVLACLLMGIMMPFIFWILSGVLGAFTLGCGLLATSNLRWRCIAIGAAGLFPTACFILVQSLPTIQNW